MTGKRQRWQLCQLQAHSHADINITPYKEICNVCCLKNAACYHTKLLSYHSIASRHHQPLKPIAPPVMQPLITLFLQSDFPRYCGIKQQRQEVNMEYNSTSVLTPREMKRPSSPVSDEDVFPSALSRWPPCTVKGFAWPGGGEGAGQQER